MTPVRDPFTPQARIREEGGLAEVVPGFWMIADHYLVREAFKRSDCLSNRPPHGRDSDSLVHLDGEEHRELRKLLARAFTPRAMRSTESVVAATASKLIDALVSSVDDARDAGRGAAPVDLVEAFTRPLPTIVMSEVLGVPASDRDRFVAWSDEAVAHAYLPEAAASAPEFEAYILGQVERARSEPGETLLHFLIDERDGEGSLSDEQLREAVRLLIIAGNETTANLLGTMFHQLLADRSQWERVLADRELVDTTVEEALRYDPPLNWVPRVAATECPFGGAQIPAGANVGLAVGAANRDPAVFENPDSFDLDRNDIRNRHLAFGYGEHYCLGAVLARVEGATALRTALDRLPGLRLAPGHEFTPKGPIMMRGVSELTVTIDQAGAQA